MAYAFCIWDGGFLPSETEWNDAASAGAQQRVYPWSSPPTSTELDCAHVNAIVQAKGCATSPQPAGSHSPTGDGLWGQADFAGNVKEWTLDWASQDVASCLDCANVNDNSFMVRAMRGGAYDSVDSRAADPDVGAPSDGLRRLWFPMCSCPISRIRATAWLLTLAELLVSHGAYADEGSVPLGLSAGVMTRPSQPGVPGGPVGAGGGLTLGGVLGKAYIGGEFGGYYFNTIDAGSLTVGLLGADVGFEGRPSADWALRPYLGLGLGAFFLGSGAQSPGRDAVEAYIYVKPSLAVFRIIGSGFVGLDVGGVVWLPSSASFSSLVEFGVRM